MERPPVDLVRVAVENDLEEETEERHVTAVFPTEGRGFASDSVQELKTSAGSRFISEAQLDEAHESGLATRDAHGQSGKSLAIILAENKQKKEDAFQEQWRMMKQGKNRPLDAEDYEFVDALYKEKANRARSEFDVQQRDAAEFKKAREELAAATEAPKKSPPSVRSTRRKKTAVSLKPQLKIVPKKRRSTVSDTDRIQTPSESGMDDVAEIPLRTRCAECNRSLDAIKAHVEKHFEASGTASRNALEAIEVMTCRPRTAEVSKRRPVFRKLKAKTEVVLRQTARERMLHFSQQLDERRRKGAKQRTPSESPPCQEEVETEQPTLPIVEEISAMALESDSLPEDVTVPEVTSMDRPSAKRPSLLHNERWIQSIQYKIEARGLILPPLCSCAQQISPLDIEYTDHCCDNCALYRNEKLHGQLLRTLLRSWQLL